MSDSTIVLETGKVYRIRHSRKGKFSVCIDSQDSEWVNTTIVAGKAGAMLDYNEREGGEQIALRKSHIVWAEEEKAQQ